VDLLDVRINNIRKLTTALRLHKYVTVLSMVLPKLVAFGKLLTPVRLCQQAV